MTTLGPVPLPAHWAFNAIQVHLVGVGGTGCQVADQLAALHATLVALGHPGLMVKLYDPDVVSSANIGRQRFTRADIGLNKAQVLAHRINVFHGLNWEAVPERFDTCFGTDHLILGCTDSVAARESMFHACGWWLDCGNDARSGHVILGQTPSSFKHDSKSVRIPTWLDLFPGTPEDDAGPSCSVEQAIRRQSWPVNLRAASIATELLYQWIREGSLSWHGALFTVTPPSIFPLEVKPETWLPFGYAP